MFMSMIDFVSTGLPPASCRLHDALYSGLAPIVSEIRGLQSLGILLIVVLLVILVFVAVVASKRRGVISVILWVAVIIIVIPVFIVALQVIAPTTC